MRVQILPAARRAGFAILAAATVLAACSDNGTDPTPTLTSIEVDPSTASVLAGGSTMFTATGRMSDGSTTTPTVAWTATGGTIADNGTYTAGAVAGAYTVSATVGSIAGTAAVTVTSEPPPGDPALKLTFISNDFTFPVFLTAPAGDPRLFVAERAGRVMIYKNGAVLATPFLDITSLVKSDAGEQGFVGLAFDPQYATNGRFFVSYVDLAGNSVLASYTVSGNPDIANAGSAAIRLTAPHPSTGHYAGALQFGAGGYLYMSIGDGGEHHDPNGHGQSTNDLLGNILRLDVSGATGYTVPASNPFVGTAGARGEIWSYGLRNPWRFSFDRANGDLYIGDVGEDTREEIDVSPASAGAGKGVNFGWAVMEGTVCFNAATCDQTGLTPPVLDYPHGTRCSVTGGYVYRGPAIPALQGTYFYADFCLSTLQSFRYSGGAATNQKAWSNLSPSSQVISFGEDGAGELYVVTRSAGIYLIAAE